MLKDPGDHLGHATPSPGLPDPAPAPEGREGVPEALRDGLLSPGLAGASPEATIAPGGLAGTDTAGPDGQGRDKRSGRRRDSFLEISVVVLLALFMALLLKTYVAEAYMIRGHSMEPTFTDGQRVMVQKVFYGIERGDIIIFASKSDPRKDLIKRVIGLPGDEVEVVDGEVFLNGEPLHEDYTRPFSYSRHERYGPRIIPEGNFFVLGDNRPESQDSRVFDEIDQSLVKGKVILRWWPAGDLQTF